MTKKEWYINRILWKVSRNKLLEQGYELYEDISEEKRKTINSTLNVDSLEFVIVLWGDSQHFTLVTHDEVISFYDSNLIRVRLDDINKNVKSDWNDEKSQVENKNEMSFIFVNGKKVWASSGNALYSLMNLLQMFPLNIPK